MYQHAVGKIREGVLDDRSRPHSQTFQRTGHMYGKTIHEMYQRE